MRLNKNANNFNLNKNYITKKNKLIHKKLNKKATFPHKDNKFVKLNDVALYKLRNKRVIEKKNFVKRKKKPNNILKKIEVVLNTNTTNEVLDKSKEKMKLNNNNNSNSPKMHNIQDSSITFTRTYVDPESKLKILDLYYKLDSFDEASRLTGIHSQTIRYWKKTEDSIKEKVQHRELLEKSPPQVDLNSMIAEAKEALKRSLSNNTTSVKSITRKSRLKSPHKHKHSSPMTNDSVEECVIDTSIPNSGKSFKLRKSLSKKTDLLELSNGENNKSPRKSMKKEFTKINPSRSSHNSSQPNIDSVHLNGKNSLNHELKHRKMEKPTGTPNNHSTRVLSNKYSDQPNKHKLTSRNSKNQSNSSPSVLRYLPNLDSTEDVVNEIDKLSNVFESKDCLESLDGHFLNLQSSDKLVFHDSLLPSKNKLQAETFKHIMIDFFQGEYKLLMEINHQYRQLKQKKSKKAHLNTSFTDHSHHQNLKKNVENLKNYFNGSMHRLLVLKQQLI